MPPLLGPAGPQPRIGVRRCMVRLLRPSRARTRLRSTAQIYPCPLLPFPQEITLDPNPDLSEERVPLVRRSLVLMLELASPH